MIRTTLARRSRFIASCACLLALAACSPAPQAPSSATDTRSSSDATSGQSVTGHIASTIGTTTATTFTTSTASTESEPTDGQSFVMPPDLASDCSPGSDNCPAGQKCVSYGDGNPTWTGAKCIDIVPDPGQPGDPCTISGQLFSGEDTCDKGSTCWFAHDLSGRCFLNCTYSIDGLTCPESDQLCSFLSDNGYTPYLCFPKCNPLTQDCSGGDLCLPFDYPAYIFTCYPPAGGVVLGPLEPCDPFDEFDECGPGLMCLSGDLAKECEPLGHCCIPFCDLTDPVCPGQDQECLPWYAPEEVPPEYTTVGACGVPG